MMVRQTNNYIKIFYNLSFKNFNFSIITRSTRTTQTAETFTDHSLKNIILPSEIYSGILQSDISEQCPFLTFTDKEVSPNENS